MGVGTIVPGVQDDANVFPDRADLRLYQAKSLGRDASAASRRDAGFQLSQNLPI